jgi:hypothetical protein
VKWIKAQDLDRWANTNGSRASLSALIGALVRASTPDITSFRFSTGDSAQIPGYDGRLTAIEAPPYVPVGESVWEFGVDGGYLGKANGDYETQKQQPGAVIPAETAFVFVTPRTWKN